LKRKPVLAGQFKNASRIWRYKLKLEPMARHKPAVEEFPLATRWHRSSG